MAIILIIAIMQRKVLEMDPELEKKIRLVLAGVLIYFIFGVYLKIYLGWLLATVYFIIGFAFAALAGWLWLRKMQVEYNLREPKKPNYRDPFGGLSK